jgi:HPt (histidine-containing phosphotransfer) domain-containing protein/PAS domain-containing protein
MNRLPGWLGVQRGPLVLGAVLALFAIAVLLPGFQLAGRLDDTAAALRIVSEQRRQPDVLAAGLTSVRDRLESFGYVDEPLSEIRKGLADLDTLVARLETAPAGAGAFDANPARAIERSAELRAEVQRLESAWSTYRQAVEPVARFQGVPYSDSESQGTQLNASGRQLTQQVTVAIAAARKQTPALVEATGRIATALEAESTRLSSYLRLLMLAALVITLALGAALTYFVVARRREAGLLADAQRQTDDILRTVKDGLFLLDTKHRIGAAHSASLTRLFKREQLGGMTFEDLLKPLVPEKTLQTALKFVEVLWSERTKENLVKSINPLQEVEVSFDNGAGTHETRWLEFDFHRVRRDGRLASLLVSVNDVTQRVQLARELADSREKAQSQLDTLLGVLHLDPQQLRSFLDDSDAATKMINAILREPAREETAFRRKLDSIFRQIHAIKGESAALGLGTVEARAHEFEDALKELRERSTLSGGDFLPLVVKLDDLLTHLASIRDLVSRLQTLNLAPEPPARGLAPSAAPAGLDDDDAAEPAPAAVALPDDALTQTLAQLVERVARDRGKRARLEAVGLGVVPADYRRAVKDIAVQAVRNAVVHGIEAPDLRERGGKPAAGVVKIEFRSEGPQGYRLVIEDDGGGLSARRIRETAVRRGLVTSEEAARLEQKQLMALLFRPGFSTQEQTDENAGRGVGMNVVAELVKELKGRIAVATGEGRYTRFTIVLPPASADAAAA